MVNRVQTALLLATLGMEACWLFGLSALLSLSAGLGGPALGVVGVAAVLGLAYGAAWVIERLDYPLGMLQLASALIGVVVVTVVAQLSTLGPAGLAPWSLLWFLPGFGKQLAGPEIATAMVAEMAGLFIWWRGVRTAQRDPGFGPILWGFRVGLTIVLFEAVLESFFTPEMGAAWTVIPFFTLGLIALSLAHFDEISQDALTSSVQRWVWLPAAVVGTLALLAASAGVGFYTMVWDLAGGVVSTFNNLVSVVFFALLFVLGHVAQFLYDLVRMLLAFFGVHGGELTLPNFGEIFGDIRPETENNEPALFLQILAYIILGLLLMLIGGSILLWLAAALMRRRDRGRDLAGELRESLWTEGALGEEMQDLLNRLLGRFRRGQGPRVLNLGTDPRSTLLRVYYQLILLAAERGVHRPEWHTPAEFQTIAVDVFFGVEPQVNRITRGFVAARYSPAEPSADLAAQAEQDWGALNRPPARPAPASPAPADTRPSE